MRKHSNKLIAAVAGTAAAVALSGVAYAYWTSTGSGTGSASTKAPSGLQLEVASHTAPSNMAPGVAAGAITVTVHNKDSNNTKAQQVIVTFGTITGPNIDATHPCTSADYTLSGATMTTGAADLTADDALAGGTDQTTFSGATLGFANSASNQDGCKGATVNLSFALS
jgi:hypothetical protein